MDDGKDQVITLSLNELDQHIQQDLAVHEHVRHEHETTKERVEGYVYLFCLIISAVFLVVHAFTDWIPFLVGLPSARVIITRFL